MNAPSPADPSMIVGEQLSAVAFVQDYVEFHFDGPVVRAISNPQIEIAGTRHVFPLLGSRDALCSLIGVQVLSVAIREGDAFVIEFESRSRIIILLDASRGPESAHFQPALINSPLSVW